MGEWQLQSPAGSPLLDPNLTRDVDKLVSEPDNYAWHVCPIDDAHYNACFSLPGVTDGTTAQ